MNPPKNEPTITLPISLFRKLLLGIRERHVLADDEMDIIPILQSIKQNELYIQAPPKQTHKDCPKIYTTIWAMEEWKSSGIRQQERDARLDEERRKADALFEIMKKKFPAGLDGNLIKHMCLQYVHNKVDLSAHGINMEEL